MNQKKKCAYCQYNNPPGFRKGEKCGITGCRISSSKGECHCGKLEELSQEDLDYAIRELPDAGNYSNDVYRIPNMKKGYTLNFRKSLFAITNIGQYVKWEFDKVDFHSK